jgi:hypothetical protein
MVDFIDRIRNQKGGSITPARLGRAFVRRVTNVFHYVMFYWPMGFSRKNRDGLKLFRNIHKGKRCFVVANGPSLNKIDFDLLKNEYTIGMNRIYLMEKINGFIPNYLAVIDGEIQLKQFASEYNALKIPCFYNWDYRKHLNRKKNQFYLKGKFSQAFSKDIVNDPVGNGLSVTYSCVQLAFYMGFEEVYLIGKDHYFKTQKHAHVRIKSDGTELNHFTSGYYNPGQDWVAPDYRGEESAYALARAAFESSGRVIKDATIDGKLDVFEKIDFNTLFDN